MSIHTSPYPTLPIPSQSVYTFLFSSNRHPRSLAAFIDAPTGRTISRAELHSLTLSLAHGLRNVLPADKRVRRGDTIMIFSPNSLVWPVAILGVFAAGARATLANSGYTPAELKFQYEDSRAHLIIAHPDLVGVVLEMFKLKGVSETEARRRIVSAELGGSKARKDGLLGLDVLMSHGALAAEEAFEGDQADETTLLCYSSGTTGNPKGVETTHRNLANVIAMIESAFAKLTPGKDVILNVLPYYHIYGMAKILLYPFFVGIPVVIMPKFDPTDFCRNIETYHITTSLIVPPILLALVHHPATNQFNMTSLNFLSCGAAPLGAALLYSAIEKLKSVGAIVDIAQGYGLTETSPVTHIVPRKDTLRKVGSIGVLLPNLEARIVVSEKDDGEADIDAKEGEPGELWIRGPTVMKGYLNNVAATRNAITPSGWFKTGDIAIVDADGFYTIVDRKKELIKYKGFQVPPAELESVLLQHPQIIDAAVIGIEDASQATELPRAYIVRKDSLPTPAESAAFARQIQTWIEGRVARHKFLRGGVVVVDAIPKSTSGKILRRHLRDRAREEMAGQVAVKARL